MAKTVYDVIKKQNGEGFARVLRDKNLLDIPNIVQLVKYAGHTATDAEKLFPYLWSLKEFKEEKDTLSGDPFQLLDEAGYHAFEVHNLEEQNSIKQFFRDNEQLCTFRDENRYQNNYIIHAIRHEVWRDPYAIQPSKTPERQDEYGTSVISIQISKSGGFISIKNRYNHTVQNPDQTFHSNPDEIIPGLSAALKGYFHVDWQTTTHIPDGFILQNEGRNILKFNFEVNNRYVGDGFYTGGQIVDIDKNNQVQVDYFIWDNRTKQLLNPTGCWDDFPRVFNEFIRDKTVTITGKSPNQTIFVNGEKCIQLQDNQITSLNMPGVTIVYGYFLYSNIALTELNMPDLQATGTNFISRNAKLAKINIPNLESVGDFFLGNNAVLTELDFPKLIAVGKGFLDRNQIINHAHLPRLQYIGQSFLMNNLALTELSLPMAQKIDDGFLYDNAVLRRLNLGDVTELPLYFMRNNISLQQLDIPKLVQCSNDVLPRNRELQHLDTPQLKSVGYNFLRNNIALRELDLPNLTDVGASFLLHNQQIQRVNAPRLQSADSCFMTHNTALTEIDFPELNSVGEQFLGNNTRIQRANLPKLSNAGLLFMKSNKKLKHLSLPQITILPSGFMQDNNNVILDLPQLQMVKLGIDGSRNAAPAINTPITDIIPERRTTAQKFRAAIKNFYNNIQIKYQTHDNRDM